MGATVPQCDRFCSREYTAGENQIQSKKTAAFVGKQEVSSARVPLLAAGHRAEGSKRLLAILCGITGQLEGSSVELVAVSVLQNDRESPSRSVAILYTAPLVRRCGRKRNQHRSLFRHVPGACGEQWHVIRRRVLQKPSTTCMCGRPGGT